MEELLTALMSRYNAAAGATARGIITGGLYHGIAKRGAALPLATFNVLPGAAYGTMASGSDATAALEPMVQFAVFAARTNALTAWQGSDALLDLYRDQLLTMTTWTMIRATLMTSPNALFNEADKEVGVYFTIQYDMCK
jgi:hypothetical protein